MAPKLDNEAWIWRPILAGKCTLEGVKTGVVDIDDLLSLNALLDMSEAYQAYSAYVQEKKAKR